MKPFAFTARCQRETIYRQYQRGVRFFDLRVRFDKNRQPIICHGLIEYEGGRNSIYAVLMLLNHKADCYVRVVLETTKPDDFQIECFRNWCLLLSLEYRNIKFFGGNDRTDWYAKNPIYQFDTPMQDLIGRYASATTRFNSRSKLLRIIDDLYPLAYAKKYNLRNRLMGTSTCNQWIMHLMRTLRELTIREILGTEVHNEGVINVYTNDFEYGHKLAIISMVYTIKLLRLKDPIWMEIHGYSQYQDKKRNKSRR